MAQLTNEMFKRLLKHEGVFSNEVGDTGGRTIYGITENYDKSAFNKIYPLWQAGKREDAQAEARKHYESAYFNKCGANRINNEQIAEQVFDIAVNMGIKVAIKLLQESINVVTPYEKITVDGDFGPKTENAVNEIRDIKLLNNTIVSKRVTLYKKISQTPSKSKFLKGWTRRAEDFLIK